MPKIFNASKFEDKLSTLTRSKDSIQSISMWIIHHKRHCNEIVNEWLKAFKKGDILYRLTLFYVANDVLQHCKKKGAPEFREAYANVLESVMIFASDERIKDEVIRLIDIWNRRSVFNPEFLKKLQSNIEESSDASQRMIDSEEISPDDDDPNTVANFRVKDLIFSLTHFVKFQRELQNKRESLRSVDDIEIPELNSIPSASYSQAVELSTQMENLSVPFGNYLDAAEQDISRRQKIIKKLEESKVFYNLQNTEVENVVHAYKVFGRKVKRLKKMLNERMSVLVNPEQTGTSTSSNGQAQQGLPKSEDPQSSSLDKRLLSMFQDSSVLGSHSESPDTFAAGSPLQDTKNASSEKDEEMETERSSAENVSVSALSNDSIPCNSEQVACNTVDSLVVKEESQSIHESEVDESMNVDSIEKDIISSPSVSQSSENQVSFFNTPSDQYIEKVQLEKNMPEDISLSFNTVTINANNNLDDVRDSQPLESVKASLTASPLKDNNFFPLKEIVSPKSPCIISAVSDSKEMNSYQSPCAISQNSEVSKSPCTVNFQQTVELKDMNLFKRLRQSNSPTRQLLKSARILNQLLTQNSQHESKSIVLGHSSNQQMIPLNSLLKLLFQHPNTSSDKINRHESNNSDKGKSDPLKITNTNEQDYLPNFQKDKSGHENIDNRQKSENSGIFNNLEFRNFVSANAHNSKFQPLLQLLINKCGESSDLISKTETLPVSCKGAEVYGEDTAPKTNEQPSSEKDGICDNLETNFIQTAPKGGQNAAGLQVRDKNLEIMDMDVDSSDGETVK